MFGQSSLKRNAKAYKLYSLMDARESRSQLIALLIGLSFLIPNLRLKYLIDFKDSREREKALDKFPTIIFDNYARFLNRDEANKPFALKILHGSVFSI